AARVAALLGQLVAERDELARQRLRGGRLVRHGREHVDIGGGDRVNGPLIAFVRQRSGGLRRMEKRDEFADGRGVSGMAGVLEYLFDARERALEMAQPLVPLDRRNKPGARPRG